jgi:multiple sugar transport system substrate-binding protein
VQILPAANPAFSSVGSETVEAGSLRARIVRLTVGAPFMHLSLLVILGFMLCTPSAFAEERINFLMWKPNQPALWDRLIGDFERETGIKVDREIGPHSSTASHALVTQKLKNRDPGLDVFMMDVVWPQELASAGWAEPLDRFFPKSDRDDFFAGALAACTVRGSIYGVPFWTSGGLLYYRKDLLEKYGFHVPETWEELVVRAEAVVRGEKPTHPALKGYSGQFKQYEGLICNMQEFVLSNGGSFFDKGTGRSTMDSSHTLAAMRFVRERIIGNVASKGVLTYEEPESLHVFIQGNAVFHRNWPYAWEISNNPEKSRVAGKVDIAVLPHFSNGVSVSTLGGWQFAISSFSRKKHLAWQFVRFMTSPKVQKLFTMEASQAPARRSVYSDPEVLRKNPHFSKLLKVFETTRPRPAIPLYPLYSDILQRFYHRALSFPDSPLDEAARITDRKVDRLLDLIKEAGL